MFELFDMGKYDFYVWSSIGIFIVALLADYINVRTKAKHIKQLIKAKSLKAKNRRNQA